MASRLEFVEYIADQLRGAGEITYRKMFGEYGMYCDGKIFSLICEDQFFVKITEEGRKIIPDLTEAPPYEGAKPYFLVEDVDNRELMVQLVVETCKALPIPKAKKTKKKPEKDTTAKKKPMSFDYKKEYKEYYMPPKKPGIITIPPMNYIAVRGKGDPNEEGGEYKQAIELLYAIAFTIKMSYKGSHKIEGYFSYVVPPLEGLWWQEGGGSIDYSYKEEFQWISMIRLPEFVTKEEFDWAISEAASKKKMDFSKVEFFTYDEGECVQCMHIGPYDYELETIRRMDDYARKNGYETDLTGERYHHEIYLSDPRRAAAEKLKTVVRHPVVKILK